MMKPRLLSYFLSAGLHGAVFAGGALFLTQKAQYGMQQGENSVEADLVAASVQPQEKKEMTPEPEPEPEVSPVVTPRPDDVVVAKVTEPKPEPVIEKPPVHTEKQSRQSETGEGSSPVPGRDRTTLQSSGGARMATGADYLRNPAPRYPEEARANRWEGVVMLLVGVSAQGRVDSISVESSSGHAVLDAAALKAVREYRFRPAEVMGVPVPCTLKVPIRFKLR